MIPRDPPTPRLQAYVALEQALEWCRAHERVAPDLYSALADLSALLCATEREWLAARERPA